MNCAGTEQEQKGGLGLKENTHTDLKEGKEKR